MREAERTEDLADGAKFEFFAWADQILGLDLVRDVGKAPQAVPESVQRLMDERAQARLDKQWARSDELRDALAELGWQVRDTPQGQQVTPTR